MKRMILRHAALLTLLWAGPAPAQTFGASASDRPTLRELAADSLQRLCGGALPVYASDGELWLEIPDCELRLLVQIDRGAGMRNRPLRSPATFRLKADPDAGVAAFEPSDTLPARTFETTPLPLARVAGTDRLLAGIGRAVLFTGSWYDCSGGILRQQRIGHERLLDADTTQYGTLLRLEAWYDVESPERGTEIQMSAGSLPLGISLLLERSHPTATPREVVVAANLPAEYDEAVRRAVDGFNRSHRHSPLTLRRGGETLPLTTPAGITFDGTDERLATVVQRNPQSGAVAFVRLRLGTASWEREALHRALQVGVPYRRLRQWLADADLRRRHCIDATLADALTGIFDPQGQDAVSPSHKNLGKEFRRTRKQLDRWERFMKRERIPARTDNTENPETVFYREMLDRSRELYLRLAGQTRGTALQGEVIEWIARGLEADDGGRFSTPTIRNNGQLISARESARRMERIWKEVLAAASPQSLSGLAELFRSTLEASGADAFAVQECFVGELLAILPVRPELDATAEALEALYTRMAGAADPETAIFARLEEQRLALRHGM